MRRRVQRAKRKKKSKTTVAALYEGVNELPGQGVPLLEQEGWLRQ